MMIYILKVLNGQVLLIVSNFKIWNETNFAYNFEFLELKTIRLELLKHNIKKPEAVKMTTQQVFHLLVTLLKYSSVITPEQNKQYYIIVKFKLFSIHIGAINYKFGIDSGELTI